MILRTNVTCKGLALGVAVRIVLWLIGLLLIFAVGQNSVHCHCTGKQCSDYSEIDSNASIEHILIVRDANKEENLQKLQTQANDASSRHNTTSYDKIGKEEGNDNNIQSNIANKINDKPTILPPHPTVDNDLQPHTSNASMDHIPNEDFSKSLYNNTAALVRGFYVFGGLGAMVVMYILVRTIRLRRKKTTVRRYGILTNREDLEMTPLGADDDEDTTIFEMSPNTRG